MKTILGVCALLCAAAVCAQEKPASQDVNSVTELKRELAIRDQVIRNLIQRIERLEGAVVELKGTSGAQPAAAPPANSNAAPAPQTEQVQNQDVDRIRAAFERTLIDRGGLVLPRWEWEIDAGFNYSHSSSEKLTIDGFTVYPVLIVGDIVSERVRRDTAAASVTGRLGLPWDMQVDVRVPYSYETSSRLNAAGEEDSISDRGIGDVEIGLSRPIWRFSSGLDLLAALRWKSTTGRDPFGLEADRIPFGTGFDAISASVTAVAADDPMVFFGTLTYTNDLPARRADRKINPGDTFGLQLGTALAVNLNTSLSFGYQQQFTTRTRVDGSVVPGSYVNTSTLSIGLSHALLSGTAFETGLSIGLSEDSPDLQLTFSIPFKPARH